MNHELSAVPTSGAGSAGSLAGLCRRWAAPEYDAARRLFDVALLPAVELSMSDEAWGVTAGRFPVPRDRVERQVLVASRDRYLGLEAISNPLREWRTDITAAVAAPAAAIDCRWCDRNAWHVSRRGLWTDGFGEVFSGDGRVRAGANWARQAPVSGLVFGDERMHDVRRLARDDFTALFATAERYIDAARTRFPDAVFFLLLMNGGLKSGASVQHAHLHVLARSDSHFGFPRRVASHGPADYWTACHAAHADLGLAIDGPCGPAWANIVPLKERDVTLLSSTIVEGAGRAWHTLEALRRNGTNSFSLAAILSPRSFENSERTAAYQEWPAVVWRLTDRGDAAAPQSDIGSAELYGSAVVSSDPFQVAGWLRGPESGEGPAP